jgi:hypothetical protein
LSAGLIVMLLVSCVVAILLLIYQALYRTAHQVCPSEHSVVHLFGSDVRGTAVGAILVQAVQWPFLFTWLGPSMQRSSTDSQKLNSFENCSKILNSKNSQLSCSRCH